MSAPARVAQRPSRSSTPPTIPAAPTHTYVPAASASSTIARSSSNENWVLVSLWGVGRGRGCGGGISGRSPQARVLWERGCWGVLTWRHAAVVRCTPAKPADGRPTPYTWHFKAVLSMQQVARRRGCRQPPMPAAAPCQASRSALAAAHPGLLCRQSQDPVLNVPKKKEKGALVNVATRPPVSGGRHAPRRHDLDAVRPAPQLVPRRAPALAHAVAHAADAPKRRAARAAVLPFAPEVPVAARLAQRVACG